MGQFRLTNVSRPGLGLYPANESSPSLEVVNDSAARRAGLKPSGA